MVVQSHKEDTSEDATAVQQSLSTSFERASQEIERASQDLASARSLGSQQPAAPLPDMADIRSRPSAVPGPSSSQLQSRSAQHASMQPVATARVTPKESSHWERAMSACQPLEDSGKVCAAGDEAKGILQGKENEDLQGSARVVEVRLCSSQQQIAQGGKPEEASKPDQALPDLWAGDNGEDDWDGDLAALMESAAALRPAAEPKQALQQPPPGPSGRGAAAPAGPAAYASAQMHPSLVHQVRASNPDLTKL